MYCMKCKNDLSGCVCEDIDERLASLNNSPHFIYRKCRKCQKHYDRCTCENPDWTTSDDNIEFSDE
ncbi:hypothetical protein LCGC14_1088420 [marine sediment metagenome]|uniref:Uncharacterized protein n=1 Tax=marine sediment metagenome TaxID=412755 RepID=A0A0F9PWB1_9ZZZZ